MIPLFLRLFQFIDPLLPYSPAHGFAFDLCLAFPCKFQKASWLGTTSSAVKYSLWFCRLAEPVKILGSKAWLCLKMFLVCLLNDRSHGLVFASKIVNFLHLECIYALLSKRGKLINSHTFVWRQEIIFFLVPICALLVTT